MSLSLRAAAVGALVASLTLASGRVAAATDFAGTALDILPAGEAGDVPPTTHSTDQLPLYDGLTPKFDSIVAADLPLYFKPAPFGIGGETPSRIENPPGHPGVVIKRDAYDVPHIEGATRDDVMFGVGWTTAEDRGFLLETLRGPGRLAAVDPPGVSAFEVAGSLQSFTPSAQTEAFLHAQIDLVLQAGGEAPRIYADILAYVDGINAYRASVGSSVQPWTANDVTASAAFVGAVLGSGGGDEVRRSELLSALQQRLGGAEGLALWNDLREFSDPEAPVTIERGFRSGQIASRAGNAIVDAGSVDAAAANAAATLQRMRRRASNALVVDSGHSTTGHPLFVAGPQTGYFYPEILYEVDLHGGGIDARGVMFPGSGPWVEIGRGSDFVWSATSSNSDVIDQFVEELCGDDLTYRFRGKCLSMTTFDAGLLGPGNGEPAREIVFHETVHGPVSGYATVGGRRVAISNQRSTRGREALNAFGFVDLNTGVVDSPRAFLRAASKIEFTFNWFYADAAHIAMFSSGRIPKRSVRVDPGLPTIGTGGFEWRRILLPREHPQVIDPPNGMLVNWNNRPAPLFPPADNNWGFGPIFRVQLPNDALARDGSLHTLASVVAAMNRAATQDLRVAALLPVLAAVLATGPAPSSRAAEMLDLLQAWNAAGASRLDRDLDGKIDDPGAAIIDAAWSRMADAVMAPVMGPQLGQLADLVPRDQPAAPVGSAFEVGWYGYVDKDLRTLLGQPVEGPYHRRFCGLGDLDACRGSLWNAIDAAGAELAAAQGPDPRAWRADALAERIIFAPGLLPATMRWTNRPTFQQVMTFVGHR